MNWLYYFHCYLAGLMAVFGRVSNSWICFCNSKYPTSSWGTKGLRRIIFIIYSSERKHFLMSTWLLSLSCWDPAQSWTIHPPWDPPSSSCPRSSVAGAASSSSSGGVGPSLGPSSWGVDPAAYPPLRRIVGIVCFSSWFGSAGQWGRGLHRDPWGPSLGAWAGASS